LVGWLVRSTGSLMRETHSIIQRRVFYLIDV
jgi:hypothetical protein